MHTACSAYTQFKNRQNEPSVLEVRILTPLGECLGETGGWLGGWGTRNVLQFDADVGVMSVLFIIICAAPLLQFVIFRMRYILIKKNHIRRRADLK